MAAPYSLAILTIIRRNASGHSEAHRLQYGRGFGLGLRIDPSANNDIGSPV